MHFPDYPSVISHPMDLTTVLTSLEEGLYLDEGAFQRLKESLNTTNNDDDKDGVDIGDVDAKERIEMVDVKAFMEDMRVIWSNCHLYNHPEGTNIFVFL